MSTSASESARAQLDALRVRFGVRLLERVEQLTRLVERARTAKSPETITEAAGSAHRLAGTAGSYGHADVSDAAAALERALLSAKVDWDLVLASLSRAQQAASAG